LHNYKQTVHAVWPFFSENWQIKPNTQILYKPKTIPPLPDRVSFAYVYVFPPAHSICQLLGSLVDLVQAIKVKPLNEIFFNGHKLNLSRNGWQYLSRNRNHQTALKIANANL